MNIIIKDSTTQVDLAAAQFVSQTIRKNPSAVLGLPTGQTPVGLYAQLRRMHKEENLSFKGVFTVNLDEYVGLAPDDPNSYRFFMQDNLFNHIDICLENTHVPNGVASDLAAECARYEQMVEALGGVDLMVLGMGTNGHIGFNEPGSPGDGYTHVVDLLGNTIADNSVYFNDPADVPRRALTMGIASILAARSILLVVKGVSKAAALKAALKGPVTQELPASFLQTHSNVTVVLDAGAASLL